jgi:hypothetical protein
MGKNIILITDEACLLKKRVMPEDKIVHYEVKK